MSLAAALVNIIYKLLSKTGNAVNPSHMDSKHYSVSNIHNPALKLTKLTAAHVTCFLLSFLLLINR